MRPGPLLEPVPQLVRLQRHPLGIEHAPSLDVPAAAKGRRGGQIGPGRHALRAAAGDRSGRPRSSCPSPMLRALQPMDVEQVLDFLVLRTIELVDHALLAFSA